MTQILRSSGVSITRFKRALLLGSVLASVFGAAPTSASAHFDPNQPPVPYHVLGMTQCLDRTYTDPSHITAVFPYQIDGFTATDLVAWTVVLWKKVDGGWQFVDNRPWVAWVHLPWVRTGYGSDVLHIGYTFDRQTTGVPLSPGFYAVVNYLYWYSNGTYTYHSDNTSPGCWLRS